MTEPYVWCEGCGRRIRNWRRYPVQALADHLGWTISMLGIHVGISGTTQRDALCHGVTRRALEGYCDILRIHPAEVWPEIIDHDIEDHSLVCADEKCNALFFPQRRGHRFCSKACQHRSASRERARTLYRNDPVWRAKDNEKSRRYQREAARAVKVRRRRYEEENRERIRQANRDYKARNRDRIKAQNAAYARANRVRINAYKRARYAEAKREAA